MLRFLRSLLNNDRGNVAIIVALSLAPLSLAAHVNPACAASANAASDTDPSEGHNPTGATTSLSWM